MTGASRDPLHPRGTGPRNWRWREGDHTVTRTICWSAPGCHGGCGALLYTDPRGRLARIEGDPANPFNQGSLCPRGLAGRDTVYHPRRLLHPLVRDGPRGSHRWRRVSWAEALDRVARAFRRIRREDGPESVVFLKGTGRDISPYISRLAYSFGSPNYFAIGPANGNACFMPRMSTLYATCGDFFMPDCSQYHVDRYRHPAWRPPERMVIWGGNPVLSNPDGFLGAWIVHCMQRGTRLVVVDPRRTWLASRAEHWLPLRPGTDAALALAMLHVIFRERLFDAEFVERWTHGAEALARRVAPCDPEWAARITGLSPESIREAARAVGRARPLSVQCGVAVDMNPDAAAAAHAIACTWSVLGQVERPGGMIAVRHPYGVRRRGQPVHAFPQVRRPRIGLDRYPLLQHGIPYGQGDALLDQMASGEPYPVRGAWIQATNTVVSSFADPARAHRLLRALDFVVVVDLFHTPTTVAFADVVLPACTFAERDGLRNSFFQLSAINRAIEPRGSSRSDMRICLEMGRRLDPEAWPWKTEQALFDHMIRGAGLDFAALREQMPLCPGLRYHRHERGELRADGVPGFATPTGRLELFSTELERFGLDPLPHWEPGPYREERVPELADRYPLELVTGSREAQLFNAEHLDVPAMRVYHRQPRVDVHPRDARAAGLEDGTWVWVESHWGRCKRRVRITAEVTPGLVHAQARWWEPRAAGAEREGLFLLHELNVNNLLPSHLQGRSGFGYPFRAMRCRLRPAGEPPRPRGGWEGLTALDPAWEEGPSGGKASSGIPRAGSSNVVGDAGEESS